MAAALRHRRRRPRVQLQLDRRPEGLSLCQTLADLRRKAGDRVLRILRFGEAMNARTISPLIHPGGVTAGTTSFCRCNMKLSFSALGALTFSAGILLHDMAVANTHVTMNPA